MGSALTKLAKSVLPSPLYTITRDLFYAVENRRLDRDRARRLAAFERELARSAKSGALSKHERKIYSQNGEDGILLYLFSRIGTTGKTFIEFGCGDGVECNTANLSVFMGWRGLLLDGGEAKVEQARAFYDEKLGPERSRVNVAQHFIYPDNVNAIFAANGMTGEIDLLSIDIDGNDYWVWKAIDAVNARVVVIEYNSSLGRDRSITVKYDRDFDYFQKHATGFYHGASLRAFTKLAREKGYVLAGCDANGINAFFVRRDAAEGKVAESSVEEAWVENRYRAKEMDVEQQFACIRDMDFETV